MFSTFSIYYTIIRRMIPYSSIFIFTALSILQMANGYTYLVNYTSLNTPYRDTVVRNETHTFIFTSTDGTHRMFTNLSYTTTQQHPLFCYIQYEDTLQTSELPFSHYQSYSVTFPRNSAARTLCLQKPGILIRLWFETFSDTPISYSFSLINIPTNVLQLNKPVSARTAPSEPIYFSYEIDTDYFDVIISSQSILCSIVSIHEGVCPPNDQLNTIGSQGFEMTMRTKASLTLKRSDFTGNSLFVVIIGAPAENCDIRTEFSSNETSDDYSKSVNVLVAPSPPPAEYWRGILFSAFVFFFPFLVVALYYAFEIGANFFCPQFKWRYLCFSIEIRLFPLGDIPIQLSTYNRPKSEEDAVDSIEFSDAKEPKIITKYREKHSKYVTRELMLPDQFTKPHSVLRRKFYSFLYFILVLSVFYGLPAIQIALDELSLLDLTNNQDLCYYNFRCERGLYSIRAFNNLLSNGAYVSYGVLFLFITVMRSASYRVQQRRIPPGKECGVPYFFGIYYAMGIALVVQGVMSTIYHTCPTRSNYQFDISFMFIMLSLIMVKLYQQRHPDGNMKAVKAFLFISCAIALSTIGLWHGRTYFVLIRIIYLVLVILFSALVIVAIYYFGSPLLSIVPLYDCFVKRKPIQAAKVLVTIKHNRSRFFQIGCYLFGTVLVLGLMFSVDAIPDFPSVILYTFIFNFALYFLYYWVMKFVKREFKQRPHVFVTSFILFIFSVICWVFALAFYFHKVKQWREPPSASRERNVQCILLDFYDYHDIWHFLSALALFSMYLSTLTIDDNLIFVKRENINIF